jgi:hypothetical protein
MSRMYRVFALGIIGIWGVSTWNGWELFASKRGRVPQNVRQSPGGYRSFVYWRGGK